MDAVLGRMGLSFQWWIQWTLVSAIGFAVLVGTIGFFLFIRKGNDWFGLYLAASFVLFGTLAGNPGTGLWLQTIPAWNHFSPRWGYLPGWHCS